MTIQMAAKRYRPGCCAQWRFERANARGRGPPPRAPHCIVLSAHQQGDVKMIKQKRRCTSQLNMPRSLYGRVGP
jgi:hypothetical protein